MQLRNHVNISVRSALFLGAATAAAMSMSSSALAQAAETVVVTGSRIPQQGLISASPVSMVSQQELNLQGTTDVGTMLNNLPSVLASQTTGEGNGSSGTVTVDLRALGSSRTLVLVDGKRLGPGDAEVPVPDLNQIPAALVDHTEVLTGGASAVYGSDAIAGVVNFIMVKDFEGVKLDATIGAFQHENGNTYLRGLQTAAGNVIKAPSDVLDGIRYDLNLVVGTNTADGKGNVTAYLGYQRQNQVLQRSRDISACSLNNGKVSGVYNKLLCSGSFNYDSFVGFTGPAAGGYYFMQPGGNLTYFTGDPSMYFNFGAYNSMIRPQTRWTGGFFSHYQVDKMLEIYANFMFMDNHNSWQAAPTALFFGQAASNQASLAGATPGALLINCDNPLMTAQFNSMYCDDTTGNAQLYIGRRNVEGGGRVTDFRHTSYRMNIGARGELWDGWTYDISAQENLTLYQQLYLHDFSKQKVQNALLVNPDGTCMSDTDNGCVPLDIFHGIGGFTPAMLDYVYTHGQRTGYTEEQDLNITIAGDFGQYGLKSPWAQAGVGVAFGAEYRKDILEETTSTADSSGDLFGAGAKIPGQPRAAVRVWETYGEAQIPVIEGMPFIQELKLNIGYRYSDYNPAGAARAYKYGLEWQPVEDIRFRASAQRAVRAPNVLELFAPQVVALSSYEDPCATSTPSASLAGCLASGMTAAQYGHVIQCPASQCQYLSGGNTGLHPEVSDTKSLGIVLTPTMLPGFNLTVDYFNIYVKDYVGTVPQSVAIGGCTTLSNVALCPLVHRGATGGLFEPDGYVIGTNVNTGYLKTSGIDFETHYQASLEDLWLGDNGSLSLQMLGTWVQQYKVQPYTGALAGGKPDYDCLGLYGISCGTPTYDWRHTARATWSTPWMFDFSVAWRHFSDSKFDGNDPSAFLKQSYTVGPHGGGYIPAFDYFDLAATVNVSEQAVLNFGVQNVFDRDPPLLAAGGKTTGQTGPLNGNTFNGIYDALGRYLFMTVTIKS